MAKTKKRRAKKQVNFDNYKQWLDREAKKKRNNLTKWENILAKHLRDLGYRFKLQVPIIHKTNGYILDFLLTDFPIFIEADGRQHNLPLQRKKDARRTRHLKKEGLEPLRFTNSQISTFSKETIDVVIKAKIEMLKSLNK